MNNCVLLAEIIEPVKMRYTQDNQTPIAEVLVQFSGLRQDDPPAKLKAVGWNNMAETLQQSCQVGQQVLLEGRLRMSTLDRPEGFKEKVAELTVSRIHPLGATVGAVAATGTGITPLPPAPSSFVPPAPVSTPTVPAPPANVPPPDYDEIPF
ncbi:MAG: single-stranded DNA-binding protein [Prochlorotrichaceae cyanobacterium]